MPPVLVTDLGPSLRPPLSPPNLVPPKSTILSPTIQQHWRRRAHGPFPFGSIFFQVKDTTEELIRKFDPCPVRISSPPLTPTQGDFFLFLPSQLLLVSPLKAVFFTRVKLPQVMEVPVEPCVIATKDVQLPIIANCKERGMSRVSAQWAGRGTPEGQNTHSQAEWLRRPSGSTGVGGQSSQASVLVSKTRMRLQ